MTNQPKWELIAQLGDKNPLEHGGYWVFVDKKGVYTPEAEKLILCDDNENINLVYRFSLDQLKMHNDMLISYRYDSTFPNAVESYKEWFSDDIPSVASYVGMTTEQLQALFCSDNPIERAAAYEAIGDYFGYVNLDSDSLPYTKKEVKSRFNKALYKNIKKG
jgi:hypothetical protein